MRDWIDRLILWVKRVRTNSDIEDELRIHLELAAEDERASGLPAEEAQRRVRLKFGSTAAVVERIGDQEIMTFLESLWRDFRFGCRAMTRTPVFSVTAILTLAAGIGANTAIFSLLYGLFWRSLPVRHSGELALISLKTGNQHGDLQTFTLYRLTGEFKNRQHSFADISFWDFNSVSMTDSFGTLRLYDAELMSGDAFGVLGIEPHLGRGIMPSDNVRNGPGGVWPVVLAYGFWNDRFGADPNVIGKRIVVSGAAAVIVGVAPRQFHGVYPGIEPKLYAPLRFVSVLVSREVIDEPRNFYGCSAIGRLRPGVSIREANAEAEYQSPDLLRQFIPLDVQHQPDFERAALHVTSARSGVPTSLSGEYSEPLLIMQGLVSVVLLLCCFNVGGLLMARVYARQHEFSVRSAIGAGRWRLARQYLTESFVIALAGSGLGGVAAWYGTPALLSFFRNPNLFETVAVQPDGIVFWMTALTAGFATVLFGTVPALRASRFDSGLVLRSRKVSGLRGQLGGRALIPVQVGLSLVLVVIATLLSQSLIRVRGQHNGFDVDRVTIQTPPFHQLTQKGTAKLDLYQRMVDRLEQMPGIRSAAVTWFTPMSGGQAAGRFRAANSQSPASQLLAFNMVGAGYFRTMETKILEGREFQRGERSHDLCVLNRGAAAVLFPRREALGQYVRNEVSLDLEVQHTCRVIGIVEDAKFASLREPAPRTLYYPVAADLRDNVANLVFLMNADTKKRAMDGYRQALREIAPTVPVVLFATLRDQMDAALGIERLITLLSSVFAGLALFLSAIGLYGLLSSHVAQRAGEIGIRIALGAQRNSVLRLILSEALRLTGIGSLFGGIGLFFALGFVQKMLFGVSGFEPVLLSGNLALLLAVTLLAAIPPALRAASIDPTRTIQTD